MDDGGNVLPPDTEGNIAVRAPDPVMFLGYSNVPRATAVSVRTVYVSVCVCPRATAVSVRTVYMSVCVWPLCLWLVRIFWIPVTQETCCFLC